MKPILGLLLLFLTLASQLNAVIQTQTITLDTANVLASGVGGDTVFDVVNVDYEDIEFIFDQFDPALGTLNDVRWSYSISHTTSFTTGSSIPDGEITNLSSSYFFGLSANGSNFSGGGGGIGESLSTPDTDVSLSLVTAVTEDVLPAEVSFFPQFQGTGTVTISTVRGNPGGQTFNSELDGYFTNYSVQRDAGATFSLTYDYTPIPEPSTYASIAGLLALLVAARGRLRVRDLRFKNED